jgi:hypothetical protein
MDTGTGYSNPTRCMAVDPRVSCVREARGVQDNAVSIATRYGLDSPGIESRWDEFFRTRADRPWGPPRSPVKWVPGLSPG